MHEPMGVAVYYAACFTRVLLARLLTRVQGVDSRDAALEQQ